MNYIWSTNSAAAWSQNVEKWYWKQLSLFSLFESGEQNRPRISTQLCNPTHVIWVPSEQFHYIQTTYIHSQKEELEIVVLFCFFFFFRLHKKLGLVDTPVSQQLGENPIHYVQYQKKLFCFFRDSVDVRSSSMKRSTNMGKLSLWCV